MAEKKATKPRKDYVAHYASITKKYNLAALVTSSYSYPQDSIVRQTSEERQRKALAAAKNTVDLDKEAYSVGLDTKACPRPNPAYSNISTTEESYRKRLRSNHHKARNRSAERSRAVERSGALAGERNCRSGERSAE